MKENLLKWARTSMCMGLMGILSIVFLPGCEQDPSLEDQVEDLGESVEETTDESDIEPLEEAGDAMD